MPKTILIVEDDPKNMTLFRDILQVSGYEIIEATDGRQGVDAAIKEKPDLILMDIQLPEMDGMEATRLIKADAETGTIPIIALTSYAMKGDREKMIENGCDDYLAKPVDIEELISMVGTYLKE